MHGGTRRVFVVEGGGYHGRTSLFSAIKAPVRAARRRVKRKRDGGTTAMDRTPDVGCRKRAQRVIHPLVPGGFNRLSEGEGGETLFILSRRILRAAHVHTYCIGTLVHQSSRTPPVMISLPLDFGDVIAEKRVRYVS